MITLKNLSKGQILMVCLYLAQFVACQEGSAEVETTTSTAVDTNQCMKRRKGCCEELFIGKEEELMKCFTLHQSKLPAEGETDPAKLIKFLSCFIECQYKSKKYLGKGDTINMKMVKSDAEKMYPNRPKERDYHIEMFEHCKKDALPTYNLIKMNPASKILLRGACRPYFMFVFLCQSDYHKKKTCPYFKWEGKKQTEFEVSCLEAKEKCYEIDGIKMD